MRRQLQMAGLMLLLLGSASAQAFNNQREAFIVGLGIGYHGTDLDFSHTASPTETDSAAGLATSVRIGFGLSNRFLLYYLSEASWYKRRGDTWSLGLNGLGMAWYFSPRAPSAYVHGGYGYSYSSLPSEGGSDSSKFGNGYILGAGYEFMPHLNLEASYLRANLTDAIDSPYPVRTGSWRLMLNYLFY